MICDNYSRGSLDIAIPDPAARLREQYEGLKDLIMDLRCDYADLQKECDTYRQILTEHHLI